MMTNYNSIESQIQLYHYFSSDVYVLCVNVLFRIGICIASDDNNRTRGKKNQSFRCVLEEIKTRLM